MMLPAGAKNRKVIAGPSPEPLRWMPANSGTIVQEQTASSEPAAAAAGYETCSGAVRPSQRVMLALGISAAMAPAMKKAGTRHSSTWAAR